MTYLTDYADPDPDVEREVALARWLDPADFLDTSIKVANELKKVIEDQKLYAVLGRDRDGRQRKHIVVEAWQTLAAMHQVYPVVEWTRESDDFVPCIVVTEWKEVEGRKRKETKVVQAGKGGWSARCVVRNREGITIGGAEAECRYEEENWRQRDSYALRSMAQTRSISKALRGTLAYIVTLAGYVTTPVEEMPVPQASPTNQAKAEFMRLVDDDKEAAKRLWLEAAAALEIDPGGDLDIDQALAMVGQGTEIWSDWTAPFTFDATKEVVDASKEVDPDDTQEGA